MNTSKPSRADAIAAAMSIADLMPPIRYRNGTSFDADPDVVEAELDCSSFIGKLCVALGQDPECLIPKATRPGYSQITALGIWLALVEAASPRPGDLVLYIQNATLADEHVDQRWHVMLLVDNATVVGACNIREVVCRRDVAYAPDEWHLRGHRRLPFIADADDASSRET